MTERTSGRSEPIVTREQAGSVQAAGTTRPGGRTARTRTAVHAAVRELVAETGDPTPSIPEIAARSGVHAATIYRRWRTPEALMLDVAVADVNERSPIPVTGDLRSDLTEYTRNLVASTGRPGGLGFLYAMVTAAGNPEVGMEGIRELVEPRMAQFQRLIDADGTTVLTPMDLVELILAPVYVGAMIDPRPIDPHQVEHEVAQLVDNVFAVQAYRMR